jgi:DNA-binding NarL/FixJ family response regulator
MGSRIEDARSAPFAYQGRLHRVLSVPRPATARLPGLTPAQQEIAGLLIDGFSRAEIAEQRGASVNTVTGQISSIFSALRVSGRYALIRAAVDVGCFDCTRVPRRYAGGMRGEKR